MSVRREKEIASNAPATNRKASQWIRYRLASNVGKLRQVHGYTQEELAAHCCMHKSYIGNVEQGTINITLSSLEALATGLACTEWELLK
jgi:transcriptional regulator with XRE-family HTH domain